MANAPLRAGQLESLKLLLPNGEAKSFSEVGWTGFLKSCPTGKSVAPVSEVVLAQYVGSCSQSGYLIQA